MAERKIHRSLSIAYTPKAECLGCSWTHPHSRITRDQAKFHVRQTGHTVEIVVMTVDTWEPNEPNGGAS